MGPGKVYRCNLTHLERPPLSVKQMGVTVRVGVRRREGSFSSQKNQTKKFPSSAKINTFA